MIFFFFHSSHFFFSLEIWSLFLLFVNWKGFWVIAIFTLDWKAWSLWFSFLYVCVCVWFCMNFYYSYFSLKNLRVSGSLIYFFFPASLHVFGSEAQGIYVCFLISSICGRDCVSLIHGVMHRQMKPGIAVEQILHSLSILKSFDRNFRCTGNEVFNLTLMLRNWTHAKEYIAKIMFSFPVAFLEQKSIIDRCCIHYRLFLRLI